MPRHTIRLSMAEYNAVLCDAVPDRNGSRRIRTKALQVFEKYIVEIENINIRIYYAKSAVTDKTEPGKKNSYHLSATTYCNRRVNRKLCSRRYIITIKHVR